MWTYEQVSGKILRPNGTLLCVAYSGHGEGLNNPSLQHVAYMGPIPQGRYRLSSFFKHPRLGNLVARFMPEEGTDDFKRSGFDFHGDNTYQNHTGSEGCIVAPYAARLEISESSDNEWLVVPRLPLTVNV